MEYFYKYADYKEIFFPGTAFVNILWGETCNSEKVTGLRLIVALIIAFLHLILGILLIVICIVISFLPPFFGTICPTDLKKRLFFGPVEVENSGNVICIDNKEVLGVPHVSKF